MAPATNEERDKRIEKLEEALTNPKDGIYVRLERMKGWLMLFAALSTAGGFGGSLAGAMLRGVAGI
jgi:hypothetical protein